MPFSSSITLSIGVLAETLRPYFLRLTSVEDCTMFGTPTLRQKLGKLQMDMV